MSGSHGAERPTGSPRRPSFKATQSSSATSPRTVASSPFSTYHGSPSNMPDPARLQYSNKESRRVNAGLFCGRRFDPTQSPEGAVGPFCTNKPAVDIDFSQLVIPIVAPERKPSAEALVQRLLHPPPHAFVFGTLSIQWVIGALGYDHITFREADERYVLAQDSILRHEGTTLGLPALYMEWLCEDDPAVSATEQGVHLTPKYFDEID